MKIAVFGTGSMGSLHASIYKSLHNVESVVIVGRDLDKTSLIAKKLGIKGNTNFEKILKDESITAVDVCLPTEFHKEYVIKAIKNGKHVFCEVPISFSLNEADEMLKEASKTKKIFQVAQLMRSVAEVSYVVEKAKSGELGKTLSVSIYRYHTYTVDDPVIELMSFDFDTIYRLSGLPKSVFAREIETNTGSKSIYAILEYPQYTCLVEMKTTMPKDFPLSHGLRVVSADGILETSTAFTDPKSSTPEVSVLFYPKNGQKQTLNVKGYDPYEFECKYFVDTVLRKVDGDLLDARYAVNTLKIATTAKKSLELNKQISFSD